MAEDIRREHIERFRHECFEPTDRQFRTKLGLLLAKEQSRLTGQIKERIRLMLRELAGLQMTEEMVAGCIEISILRVSFYLGRPQLCIEIYDADQSLGNCLMETKLEISFLYDWWMEYFGALQKQSAAFEWSRFLSDEVLYTLMQDSLDNLMPFAAFLLKYQMEDCHEWTELKELAKTDVFYISAGGYRDWQKLIFVQRKPFDLLLCDEDESMRFGRFEKLVYYQKQLEHLDLKASYFAECRFQYSHFEGCRLNDCFFEKCTFVNVDFIDVEMFGTVWKNCSFTDCKFGNVQWTADYDFTAEEIEDCYRPTAFCECRFSKCNVKAEDLAGCRLIHTDFDSHMPDDHKY